MDGIRLELLGPPEVLRDGQVAGGVGRKAIGLLAFLAAPKGRFHNRDELAGLLWSDRFDEQARQSLRQMLSMLRKKVGDAIVTNDHGVALAADKVVSDVEEFEALAASEELEHLRQACALYRGEFLEGVRGSAPAFDEWAESERRRLRDRFLNALESLARQTHEQDQREEALTAARRLVAEEPAHEAGHRLIMQILAQQGQRAAALRQFEACQSALKRHLDAKPEAQTIELAERIRAAEAQSPSEPGSIMAPWPMRALRRRPVRRILAISVAATALLAASTAYFATRSMNARQADASAQCVANANLPGFAAPAVVVLPFDIAGRTDHAAALAEPAAELVAATLGAVPRLSVVTGPPRGHADLRKSRRQLADELGVTHVLDGAVRTEGDQGTINVRLIDGASGEVLWSSVRTYPLNGDLLAVRDQIAIDVARAAQRELTDGRQALHFQPYETSSLAVLERVYAGSELISQPSRSNNRLARSQFEAALEIEPNDAPAHAGLAFSYATDVLFGWSSEPERDLARAELHTARVEQIQPDYFYVRSLAGLIALLRGDHTAAVAHGEDALRKSGSGADAVALHALTLSYTGDIARSLELAQRAMRLRPYVQPQWYRWVLARSARLNGDPRVALDCLPAKPLEEAEVASGLTERALALSALGDTAEARRTMALAQHLAPFTAESYCARPPYADRVLTQRCIASAARAGAPHASGR